MRMPLTIEEIEELADSIPNELPEEDIKEIEEFLEEDSKK